MAVLVIAEHDGKQIKPGTANAVTAAGKMGGDITVLVAGHQCGDAALTPRNSGRFTKPLQKIDVQFRHK